MLIGIVGLGGIARRAYLPILAAQPGIELALCSRTTESVRQVQEQYRIKRGTTDLKELIGMGIGAAFVLSASETHASIVRELLEAGVDVLVEKPATQHSRETRELAELADKHKRVLMVAFNRRYAPLHVAARQEWGERAINMALFQKHRPTPSYPSLEDQFGDDTIHYIDTLRFFCGEGEVVGTVQYTDADHLLGATSTVALERGGYAMVLTSLQAARWQESYTLHGAGRSMLVEAFSRLRLMDGQGDMLRQETYDSSWRTTLEGRGFKAEIEHFLDCIEKRDQPRTSAWDSVRTQELLEKMTAKITYSQVEKT